MSLTPQDVGNVGIWLSGVLSTTGLLLYGLTARWWSSRAGWHVFWFMAVITWIIDLILVRMILGDAPWFAWLRALSFAVGLPAVLGWRIALILGAQVLAYRGGRHRERGMYDQRTG